MKVFRCIANVRTRKTGLKTGLKAWKHVFFGYHGNSTAYLLHGKMTPERRKAKNVFFNEKKVAGFTNKTKEHNNDDPFDVTLNDEIDPRNVEGVHKQAGNGPSRRHI